MTLEAVRGGAQALGLVNAGIRIGARADRVSLDLSHAAFAGRTPAQLLDVWVFTGARAVDCVWAGGRKLVDAGRHVAREAVERQFGAVMRELQL